MIHPSYVELMRVLNDDVIIGEEPVVNSRYSIVCAAAKRARQLIDGSDSMLEDRKVYGKKPLSIAVQELSEGHLKILTPEEAEEQQEKLNEIYSKNDEIRSKVASIKEKQSDAEGDDASDDE